MDSSSLGEVLHIPITLTVRGGCPQTYSFPDLPLHCFTITFHIPMVGVEILSRNSFLLHSGKEMVGSPSSVGSFHLVSYPSRIWETLSIVYIGRITFVLS